MRQKANTTQNRAPRVIPSMPWRVEKVHPLKNYCIEVVFLDGTKGFVELSSLITSNEAGVFAALRDHAFFDQVYIDYGVVTWPGEIDLAPDAMYREIKQRGRWVISG